MSAIDLTINPRFRYTASVTRARIQIQRPEISTYKPAAAVQHEVRVGFIWKLMVGLTYLFSLITLSLVYSV